MDPKIAKAYWDKIERSSRMFISINHEVNPFTVKELIDTGTRVASVQRMIYSMRRGYVEELVKFTTAEEMSEGF